MFTAGSDGAVFRSAVNYFADRQDFIDREQFRIEARNHDTGCSVRIHILADGKPIREIVNTTYWYYERYTFNDSKWEKGAWDSALAKVIAQLREDVNQEEERRTGLAELREQQKAQRDAAQKAEVEKLFT